MEKNVLENDRTEDEVLTVKLWGTRGSCAAPFPNRMTYGGNTSCISVHWKEGIAVFDAGTGILALGQWLIEQQKQKAQAVFPPIYLFISHLHLDHVLGLPLFPLLFYPCVQIHIYGPGGKERSFRQYLTALLSPPYWPVSVGQVPASVTWHEADGKESWELLGHVRVSTMPSYHPDNCILYRLQQGTQSIVYGLDCEFPETKASEPESPVWTAYKTFAHQCSLLIFDAPYTKEEYPSYRGFGHSDWEKAVQMAQECQTSHLCICHHNWDRSDQELAQIEQNLKRSAQKAGVIAEMGREGRTIALANTKLEEKPNKYYAGEESK